MADTWLQIDHDYHHDRLQITISMPAGRWRAALMNCSLDTLGLLSHFASSNRLADLFMHLAIVSWMKRLGGEARLMRPVLGAGPFAMGQ